MTRKIQLDDEDTHAPPPAPSAPQKKGKYDAPQGAKRVENNTDGHIYMPFAEGWESSASRLVKARSIRTFPAPYWEALYARTAEVVDRKGTVRGERYPGRESVEKLVAPVWHYSAETYGKVRGPRITIYERDQAPERPDGPNLPESLDTLPQRAALKFVEICTDKAKLEAWKHASDKTVAEAAVTRLRSLP